ncbi:MAG: ATP-binding protein [Epsilonproteobacteria bacterium]|nr:ATP-binding protein [Campylobacterota bacterium]
MKKSLRIICILALSFTSPLFCADNSAFWKAIGKTVGKVIDAGVEAAEKMTQGPQDQIDRLNREIDKLKHEAATLTEGTPAHNNVLEQITLKMAEIKTHQNNLAQRSGMVNTMMGSLTQAASSKINDLEKERDNQREITKQVAIAKKKQELKQQGAMERLQFFLQPQNLSRIAFLTGMTGGALIGTYFMTKFLYVYLEKQIGRPKLVRESSIYDHTLWTMFKEVMGIEVKAMKDEIFSFDNLIMDPELTRKLKLFADMTKNKRSIGLPYQHLMLYGKPGTGKTMFARILSYHSGMDYAIMSGADFAQFKEGEDITELHNLFDWAEQSSKDGLIIFIDEADAALRSRRELSERGVKLVNAFLSRTGTSSKHFMLIFATNYPDDIDAAVLSRVNKKINIPLPGHNELIGILNLYMKKYLIDDIRVITIDDEKQECGLELDPEITAPEFVSFVAKQMKGFSGREVEQFVDEVRSCAYATPDLTLTKALFVDCMHDKVAQHKNASRWDKAGQASFEQHVYSEPSATTTTPVAAAAA